MKQTKKRKASERFVVVLVTLLFLTSAVYAGIQCIVQAPPAPDLTVSDTQLPADEDTGSEAETIPSGRERKEYCYNILVSGLDDDNGGSDTNLLVRFDAKNKSIDVVSLPRDTLLNHTWTSNKLNFAYAKGGTKLLMSEIENLLGIPVDFYITVDFDAFIALVDQIGGVTFDVPVNMDYDDPFQNLSIHIPKGVRHLNGEEAIKVVRWRKNNDGTGYVNADIGRINTQQAFLKEVARQTLQLSNVKNIPALADIFFTYVKTDLSLGNLIWLGTEALGIGMENVRFHTLPGDGSGYYRGESVYVLDRDAVIDLVNDALNPYTTPINAEDADILVP